MAKRKTSANGNGESIQLSPVAAANVERIVNEARPKELSPDAAMFNELVQNALLSRQELIRSYLDPRRDINKECGYPEDINQLDADDYRDMYDSDPIAARVVEAMPKECWQIPPEVFELEDGDQKTEFEKAVDEVGKSIRGQSWLVNDQTNPIWNVCKRADILSRIGHFGIILIGLDDNKELDQPVAGMGEDGTSTNVGKPPSRKLIFLRPYDESMVKILRVESRKNNPRYGLPTAYQLTVFDPNETQPVEGTISTTTVEVHWTRVVHIAESLGSSDVLATPAMRPVWPRLLDLQKLYGGSAEMYWRGAFPGLSIETHPSLGGIENVTIDQAAIKRQMTTYMDKLQRYLAIVGATTKSLAPQVVDPTPQIDTQLGAICIYIAMPKRIFTGSERGELASDQDDNTFEDRKKERKLTYLTPVIVGGLFNRLIQVSVLPTPTQFNVDWPEADTLKPTERAEILAKRTDSIVKYVGGDGDNFMGPIDFLTREMGYTDKEAKVIYQNTLEYLKTLYPDRGEGDVVPGHGATITEEDELASQGRHPDQLGEDEDEQPKASKT